VQVGDFTAATAVLLTGCVGELPQRADHVVHSNDVGVTNLSEIVTSGQFQISPLWVVGSHGPMPLCPAVLRGFNTSRAANLS